MKEVGGKNGLSLKEKVGYGLGQLSEGVAYNFFYYFYTFFLVSVVGLNPAIAGMLSGFAVIWDAFTDLIVGYISDFCGSPKGKRRAFFGRAAIPLGIMVALICYVPPIEGPSLIAYLMFVNIFFWMLFTACDVPWIALGNEFCDDFDEKSSVRSISTGFMLLGQLIASGFTLPLISWFCETMPARTAWLLLGVILGVIAAGGFLVSYFTTAGLDSPSKLDKRHRIGLVRQIGDSLRIRGIVPLLLLGVVATAGTGIFLSGEVFYLDIYFQYNEFQISVINIVFAIVSFFLSYYVGWLAEKLDKKKVLLIHECIAAFGLFITWLMPPSPVTMILTLSFFYLADVTFWTVIFSVLGDVIELQSYRDPEKDIAGIASSLVSVGNKVGTALGMWMLGVGLNLIGYVDGAAITTALQNSFGWVFYLPLVAFFIMSAICVHAYPYSRDEYLKEKARLTEK